ncbi:hypothetical protein DIS24_g4322 [Lasiodiplodia hormozganensis]|uniref:Peptidase A1 domain-containing protein n=1 Tax=Lasiodiplodia hormozganensis TaxID=869390 RepID=A0AA39YUR8_9PEZI|nr:hypothetical protein DIS24_g4322 [Lasiodiplodia hormozganensis]
MRPSSRTVILCFFAVALSSTFRSRITHEANLWLQLFLDILRMSANGRDKPRHRPGNDRAQGLRTLKLRSNKSTRNILSQNDFNPEEEDQVRREDLGSSVGESFTVRFDAAEEYDLTAGGNFTAVALGFIPFAEGYSTFLNGSTIAYHSNDVTAIDVKDSCEGDLLAQVAAASFLY